MRHKYISPNFANRMKQTLKLLNFTYNNNNN